MVDLGLKPSLATFPFRTQPEELPAVGALHEAEEGDDALLAMMDRQAEVASKAIKAGQVRHAVHILHSSYRMVETYIESFPETDPIPPAAMLAAATVRLALCVILSSMHRHKQALDEAKMAAVEMDKVWRLLFTASAEQEAATADGDRSRPAAPLRDALRNPPKWLERAVETAVQARHCIAIELEFETPAPSKSRSTLRGGASVASTGLDVALSSDSVEAAGLPDAEGTEAGAEGQELPDPVPISESLTVQEQIGKLHREGVQLARQLLPETHPVRNRAELAMVEWLQRTGGDGQPNLPRPTSPITRASSRRKKVGHVKPETPDLMPMPPKPLSPSPRAPALGTSASAPKLCQSLDLPGILRLERKQRLPPHKTSTNTASTASFMSTGLPQESSASSSRIPKSLSVGTFASQISGELPTLGGKKPSRPSSQPEGRSSSKDSKGSKDSASEGRRDSVRKGSKERRVSVEQVAAATAARIRQTKTPQQKAKEAAILLAQKDPFEDWRRNMVNEAQMTHFQRQLKTNEGLSSLQNDMKDESMKFTHFMKEFDDDALFENRTKFGPSGLKSTQNAEKRSEKFNSQNWEPTEEGQNRTRTKTELFHYFGTKITGDEPSLANMSKLLQKSLTQGANLTKMAEEEKKRQEAERARLRQEKLCRESPSFQKAKAKRAKSRSLSPKGKQASKT